MVSHRQAALDDATHSVLRILAKRKRKITFAFRSEKG
jgi:hypothetical protein